MRNIDFSEIALSTIQKQVMWYRENYINSAIQTMMKNLHSDISTLAFMPTIGKKLKVSNGQQYYTFPSRKKADIIYRFDDDTLYIANIIFHYSKK